MNKKEKTLSQRFLTGFGITVSVIVLPVLIINLIILAESWLHPDEIPKVFGLSPMVVLTESMSPTIDGGDMILAKKTDPEALKEGDIITFVDPAFSSKVVNTHRIVGIEQTEEGLLFTTRGDSNNADDSKPVPAENVVGLYVGKIPKLGKLVLFMRTTAGILIFVVLPLTIFLSVDMVRNRKERREAEQTIETLQRELQSMKPGK